MTQSDELKARAATLVEELKQRGKYLLNPQFKFTRAQDTNVADTIRIAREALIPAKPKRRTRRVNV